jgi:hypothetical protein
MCSPVRGQPDAPNLASHGLERIWWLATPARTIEGIRFKLRFVPSPWLDPVMMRSVVEDLLVLA